MPSGFGSAPFGSSSYGIGAPDVASALGGIILRDPATGASFGSRAIDPRTGDYVLDENGRALGMPNVMQLVQLAMRTVKNSSAMRGIGHELDTIENITPATRKEVETKLEEAVAHLVSAGFIQTMGLANYQEGPTGGMNAGAVQAVFLFRDLVTGTVEKAPL